MYGELEWDDHLQVYTAHIKPLTVVVNICVPRCGCILEPNVYLSCQSLEALIMQAG